jgi:hypothetical protein
VERDNGEIEVNNETGVEQERLSYLGKVGEYRVLSALLERGIEAYPAIRTNQRDYDITAIPNGDKVVRIQVKATVINNRSTNNAVSGTEKQYDFLVLVVFEDAKDDRDEFPARFFILTWDEVTAQRGEDKRFGVSRKCDNGEYRVREVLSEHESKWEKIIRE